jgi:3,4-dihydroxy 2-butanone 4-phosphate synthase / GTP cyclohydrolase II
MFSSVKKIIQDAKKGKIFILVDDKNRENEGDLVIPAAKIDHKKINFMATHGRGLICLAIDKNKAKALNLSLMPSRNSSRLQTAFTISIEARKGVTTGISAKDRAHTIKTAIKKNVRSKDISTPGHIFPLIAKDGGVLQRAGHTEAAVDIAKLSGCGFKWSHLRNNERRWFNGKR